MRRIVLDTNCLLQSISRRSVYYRIWRDFVIGRYQLCVTTEIVEEYAEIFSKFLSPKVGQLVVEAILRANNTVRVDAQFIVTNDAHFDCLKDIPFPRVIVKDIDEFLRELE